MRGPRLLSCALLCGLLGACTGGFQPVLDAAPEAGPDGRPADGPLADGSAADRAPAVDGAGGACAALARAAGPFQLGYAGSHSMISGLAAAGVRVGAVWEYVDYDQSSASLAVLQPDGRVTAKGRELAASDYAPFPAITAIGDGFGVLRAADAQQLLLIYERVNAAGATEKTATLASNPGGYLSGLAIAAGAQGIAVGYTRHGADQRGTVQLGAIDADGASVAPLRALGTENGSWDLALAATAEGYLAVWDEVRPGDCSAVVAAWLDRSLAVAATPGRVTVFEDAAACHQRPAVARVGDEALICAERVASADERAIVCRALHADGSLGPTATSEAIGLLSVRPQVVAAGAAYAVLWTAKTTGLEEIHARMFAASGAPLAEARRISEDGVRSYYPVAVWTGAELLAAWYRYVPITVYYAAFRLRCGAP